MLVSPQHEARRASLHSFLGLALLATALPWIGAAQQGPPAEVSYNALTDTRRSFTNFNVEVVRGFVVEDDASELFAINAYESTLMRFTPASVHPTHRWHTLNAPVSVAFHRDDLLVVGQGSHAIARHDRATGQVLDVLVLDSEPADVVVDADNDEAWVSCMGDDTVLQISLSGPMSLIKRWGEADSLLVKRPRFLHLARNNPDDPTDNWVYVAPMLSGNNTLVHRLIPRDEITDGNTDPLLPFNPAYNGSGLPDYDLFRIRPSANTVDPVLRGVGSLMLGHGINPFDNAYWLLNVDEINADPNLASEPALRGVFAENELDIVTAAALPAPGSPPIGPTTTWDLDDTVPSTPAKDYVASRSVSFPYALDFHPTGWAAVGSSTTPNLVLCDSTGARQFDMSLSNTGVTPPIHGNVIRTVKILDPFLLAYCQQTSNILVWALAPFSTTPFRALRLGSDPTPDPVREGRRIWYDAVPSLDGRTTCNTCHPQGGADGLVWRIANVPVDDKGPMVTQPLFGIEDTFPYHWRGERAIEDFNGAFPGLLGHPTRLSDADMERFREFVFSLQMPANALQDPDRRVKDSLVTFPQTNGLIASPLVGDPTDGQNVYHNVNSDGVLGIGTCVACHANPTGSNGDFFPDLVFDGIPHRTNFEPTQLDNQIDLKRQPLVPVLTIAGAGPVQLLGSGFLHNGQIINLFDFNDFFFPLTPKQKADVTAFVHLFDTGNAPSTHWAALLDSTTSAATIAEIQSHLLNQAALGWVGVVAFGTFPVGGVAVPMSWYYDPALARLVPEDGTVVGPQPFASFQGDPLASNVFMGVPPGNEFRVGVDVDNDGLDTGGEIRAGTSPWDPDTDGDGFPDGYEVANGSNPLNPSSTPADTTGPLLNGSISVDFVNASQVKLFFQTNEPARWEITCSTTGGATTSDSRLTFDTVHTAVVHKLAPSTLLIAPTTTNVYSGTLTLTDLSGNTSSVPIPTFSTGTLIHDGGRPDITVVGDLALRNESRVGSAYSAVAGVRIDWRENSPPAVPAGGQVVVVQVLKQDPASPAGAPRWIIVPAADVTSSAPATTFTIGGVPYGTLPGQLPGPFLVLNPTASSAPGLGTTGVSFSVANLTSGEAVMLNVLAVLPAPPNYQPANPAFPGGTRLSTFQIPATKPENRNVESSI